MAWIDHFGVDLKMVLLSAFWPSLGKHFPGSLVKNTVNYNTRPSLGTDSELEQ